MQVKSTANRAPTSAKKNKFSTLFKSPSSGKKVQLREMVLSPTHSGSLHSLGDAGTFDLDPTSSLQTELSDMFDPAALQPSFSKDQPLRIISKCSSEMEEGSDTKNSRRILKFKSPIKVLRSRKKKDETDADAREEFEIFEEKEPIDLLDDDRENDNPSSANDTNYSNAESVLPFTTSSNISGGLTPLNNVANEIGLRSQPSAPFATLRNLSLAPSADTKEKSATSEAVVPSLPTVKNPTLNLPSNSAGPRVIPKPTPVKYQSRQRSIDSMFNKLFMSSPKEKEDEVDMSIGLRLALPDKLDIMTGSTPIKESNSITPSKKLIILPEEMNSLKKTLRMNGKSPFKRRPGKTNDETTSQKNAFAPNVEAKKVIVLRTSELEPSVHQISIPEATELLIHARVCASMEGYDNLLEARAKAGKRWFSFGHLVGVSRKDLENMYLCAIGKKPDIPMFIGQEDQNLPPPLPNVAHSSYTSFRANPFEKDEHSLSTFKSLHSGDSGIISNSRYPRMRSTAPKAMVPHPSTIKSLLECADDLIVEGYFNETIGSENDLMGDVESTSVQVAVFSSQRQRQFIVCYRGTIGQHTKPVRSKDQYELDSNGLNETFGSSYFQSELEGKVFDLVERLSAENPFCDVVFIGHSFGGGLATIGALRCAENYPMMTVSCHGFGVPKVGQKDFRLRAHSLPNLKIIRVEHCSDVYVHLPVGPWEHVGHTVTINYSKSKKRTMINPKGNEGDTITATAQAFKFGRKNQNTNTNTMHRVRNTIDARANKVQGKADHEMRNYLHALEHFTHMGNPWVSSFANELGSGIVTAENEVRLVV